MIDETHEVSKSGFSFDFLDSTVSLVLTIAAALGIIYRYIIKPSFTLYKYVQDREDRIGKILSELNANGGSSIKDQLNRIEARQLFSEQISKITLSSNGIGFWKADKTGQFTEISPIFCRITGRSETELSGSSWSTWIHSEDKEEVFDEWSRCTQEMIEFNMSYRYVRPDDTIVSCHGAAYPIFNGKNEIIGFLGVLTEKN